MSATPTVQVLNREGTWVDVSIDELAPESQAWPLALSRVRFPGSVDLDPADLLALKQEDYRFVSGWSLDLMGIARVDGQPLLWFELTRRGTAVRHRPGGIEIDGARDDHMVALLLSALDGDPASINYLDTFFEGGSADAAKFLYAAFDRYPAAMEATDALPAVRDALEPLGAGIAVDSDTGGYYQGDRQSFLRFAVLVPLPLPPGQTVTAVMDTIIRALPIDPIISRRYVPMNAGRGRAKIVTEVDRGYGPEMVAVTTVAAEYAADLARRLTSAAHGGAVAPLLKMLRDLDDPAVAVSVGKELELVRRGWDSAIEEYLDGTLAWDHRSLPLDELVAAHYPDTSCRDPECLDCGYCQEWTPRQGLVAAFAAWAYLQDLRESSEGIWEQLPGKAAGMGGAWRQRYLETVQALVRKLATKDFLSELTLSNVAERVAVHDIIDYVRAITGNETDYEDFHTLLARHLARLPELPHDRQPAGELVCERLAEDLLPIRVMFDEDDSRVTNPHPSTWWGEPSGDETSD